jgi:hypothetical protein
MRNLRSVIFGLGCLIGGAFLADYFGAELGAQQQTVERIWAAEDCRKISGASGTFLYVAGENLGEGDKLRNEGYDAEARESYESGLRFSEMAANYARNFEVVGVVASRRWSVAPHL